MSQLFLANNSFHVRGCLLYEYLKGGSGCPAINFYPEEHKTRKWDAWKHVVFPEMRQRRNRMLKGKEISSRQSGAFNGGFVSHFGGLAQPQNIKRKKKQCKRQQKPRSFELYLKICENLGKNAIDWRDAEVLYWQFKKQNYDLQIDYGEKPRTLLTDLPVGVLSFIVKKLDYESRSKLGLTCHGLRNLVNSTDYQCVSMEFILALENDKYVLEWSIFDYPGIRQDSGAAKKAEKNFRNHRNSNTTSAFRATANFFLCVIQLFRTSNTQNLRPGPLTIEYFDEDVNKCLMKSNKEKTINLDFMELAFKHIGHFLSHTNLKIENLTIQTLDHVTFRKRAQFFESIENILKIRQEKLNVTVFNLHTNFQKMHALSVLPYLMDGTLEAIDLYAIGTEIVGYEEEKSTICELEQWKKAKKLKIHKVLADLSVRNLSNFDEFEGALKKVLPEDFAFLKETFLKSLTFKKWRISLNNVNIDSVNQVLGSSAHHRNDFPGKPDSQHYQYPDSSDVLVLKIGLFEFVAERKNGPLCDLA